MVEKYKQIQQLVVEFKKYHKNLHIVLIYLVVSVVCGIFCEQLRNISYAIKSPINIVDAFIMINNNKYSHLFIVIGILLINSSSPFMDDDQYVVLIRTGKTKWLNNRFFLSVLNVLIYLTVILGATILFTINISFVGNYWSILSRGTAMNLGYVISNGPPVTFSLSMINSMPVYEAALQTFLLMAIYCIFLSEIILVINLKFKSNVGFVFAIGVHFIGWVVNYLKDDKWKYISPMNNSILVSHNYGIGEEPAILYSYLFLLMLFVTLLVLSKRIIHKCDF